MRLALLALILGSLSATNAWDVPVYALLSVASILTLASAMPNRLRGIALFLIGSASLVVGSWALFLPFHSHFVALFSQIALVRDPTDLLQFLGHLGGLLAICSIGLTVLMHRDRENQDAQQHAPWLACGAGLVGLAVLTMGDDDRLHVLGSLLVVAALGSPPLLAAALRAMHAPQRPEAVRWAIIAAAVLTAFVAGACTVALDRPVFGMLLIVGVASAFGWLLLSSTAERFVCLLLAAGFFTAAGTEIIVVADDLIGTTAYRMNTVFKFYNQIWVLLALSAAALAALMLRSAIPAARSHEATRLARSVTWSRLGIAVTVAVIMAAATYPVLAIGPRLAQRFDPGTEAGSLNALGWMSRGTVPVIGAGDDMQISFAGDAAAISWLNENVEGTPVIAEASIGPYRCNGTRIASATGLPTIIGWERHEQQQRYPEVLPARVDDVRRLYTSPDPEVKTAILRKYNVEFVVVGDLERLYPIANNECTPTGSTGGISAFDSMIGSVFDVVFVSGGTTIYQVRPAGAT
jgi:YYY domain-containing protein